MKIASLNSFFIAPFIVLDYTSRKGKIRRIKNLIL